MAKKASSQDVLLELVRQYDRLRTEYTQLEKDKNAVNNQIKDILLDKEEANVPGYRVTYKYDKDKEVTSFDEEKFVNKDPKGYAKYLHMVEEVRAITDKYTKTKTVPGARKLLVVADEH